MKKAQAFTLVELMIVVGIIGILASLAIPNFMMFMAKAKQAEVKGNLINEAIGLEAERVLILRFFV